MYLSHTESAQYWKPKPIILAWTFSGWFNLDFNEKSLAVQASYIVNCRRCENEGSKCWSSIQYMAFASHNSMSCTDIRFYLVFGVFLHFSMNPRLHQLFSWRILGIHWVFQTFPPSKYCSHIKILKLVPQIDWSVKLYNHGEGPY